MDRSRPVAAPNCLSRLVLRELSLRRASAVNGGNTERMGDDETRVSGSGSALNGNTEYVWEWAEVCNSV
jgi:hypothetical protein